MAEEFAEGTIKVSGAGIRYKRNRASRRSFKDLFAVPLASHAPSGEFWALRGTSTSVVAPARSDRRGRAATARASPRLLKLVAQVVYADEGTIAGATAGWRPLSRSPARFANDLLGARQRLPDGRAARR